MQDIQNPNNQFADFEDYDDFSNLNTDSLLTEVWLKPKLVFKYLFKTDPEKYIWVLMAVAGATSALENAFEKMGGHETTYKLGLVMGAVVIGVLFGWLSFYLYSGVLSIIGRSLLGGKARSKQFRTVLAWSSIPSSVSIIFSILVIAIYGAEAYNKFDAQDVTEVIVFAIAGLAQVGLGIWSLVITVQGTMLIQDFKLGKALVNVLLPVVSLIILIVVLFVFADVLGNA